MKSLRYRSASIARAALIVASIFLVSACGNDGPAMPDAVGSGTLELDGEAHAFEVRACDFGGDSDEREQTLAAEGVTDAGEPFSVIVSRNDVDGMLMHTVSYQRGEMRRGDDRVVLEARRLQHDGRWQDDDNGPDEPLIQIDGNRLTAEAYFHPADTMASNSAVEGRIEATCNP